MGNRNSGRHRQPVESLSKGTKRTSLDKANTQKIEGIRGSTAIVCPDWITDDQQRKYFERYANLMNDIGVWSERYDSELGTFVSALSKYIELEREYEQARDCGDFDRQIKAINAQDKAYRQLHGSATVLGLNVSGHLKHVGTKEQPEPDRLAL